MLSLLLLSSKRATRSLWQINYDNLCYLGYTLINRSREVIMQDQTPSIESAPLVHLPDPNAIVNIDEDGNFSFKSPDETSEPKPQEPEEYHDYLQKKINELIRKIKLQNPWTLMSKPLLLQGCKMNSIDSTTKHW